MYILRFEVKQHVSALYGHNQVLFPLRFSLYKLSGKGCDVEISHQIIILVCLSDGISPHRNPFHAIYIAKSLREAKPDDGHIRPKHVV